MPRSAAREGLSHEKRPQLGPFFGLQVRTLTTLPRLAFVAANGATRELFAFHALKSRFGFFAVGHLDKAESTRPSGLAIVNDLGLFDFAEGFECLTERDVVHAPREVTYKNVHLTEFRM